MYAVLQYAYVNTSLRLCKYQFTSISLTLHVLNSHILHNGHDLTKTKIPIQSSLVRSEAALAIHTNWFLCYNF